MQNKFTDRVLNVVARIPKGKVLTYKEVARRAGSVGAYRAVGNILNKNYNKQIPCHRVIRSDGQTGGYNRGAKRKIALLKKEHALVLLGLFFGFSVLLPSVSAAEVIDSFETKIYIRQNSNIDIEEHIFYDFDTIPHHGMFRDIPVHYNAHGGNFNLRLSNVSVLDAQGVSYPFSVSYMGDNVRIKIGDPNVLITGKHTYIIRYTMGRALNFFSDHDELYWNATGDKWPLPIKTASVEVYAPSPLDSSSQLECFRGVFGSRTPCAAKFITAEGGASFASGLLNPGEGLTFVLGLPKGMVIPPTTYQIVWDMVVDNWVVLLPILVLLFMIIQWFRHGRDAKGTGVIIAQYEAPDGLTPIEVGALAKERVDKKGVAGEIISLAVRGYLKITRLEEKGILFNSTDYSLQKLKPVTDLANFDQELNSFLFSEGGSDIVRISAFKQSRDTSKPRHYKLMQSEVLGALAEKGYFAKNPETTRGLYFSIGAVLVFLSLFILQANSEYYTFAGIAAGIIIILFSSFMPAKTKKGVLAREHILGLKLYLSVAEKDRIAFHNAPEKNPEHFEALLPYAMVLGVEKEWAKQFEGINMGERTWYADSTGAGFNPGLFVASSHSFASAITSTVTSASGGSGLGGGGGAGGGGGGGGGGGW